MTRNPFVIYLNAMSPLRLHCVATVVAVYPSAMDEQPLNADILDLATHKACHHHVAMLVRELLPHIFTLTSHKEGGYFLSHYSTVTDSFPLGNMMLCVARTFLTPYWPVSDKPPYYHGAKLLLLLQILFKTPLTSIKLV